MAPKSAKNAVDEKMLTLSYKDFMENQNEMVNAINQHYSAASSIMMASSRSMQTILNTLLRVRESATTILANSGLGDPPAGLDKYPALASLLKKDQNELYNPMVIGDFSLGVAGVAPARATSAPPAKQSKMKKARKPKDPNAPKRPQTAFFLYLDANREAMKEELGDDKKPGDVAREQALRWNQAPAHVKELYKKQYQANFEEYKHELEEYKARGGQVADTDLHPADDDAVVDKADGKGANADDDSDSDSSTDSVDSDVAKSPTPPPPPKAVPVAKGRKGKSAKAAAKEKEDEVAKIDPRLTSPVKDRSPEKKKGKAATAMATTGAKTRAAKADSPEESKKRKGAKEDSPEGSSKKKRKSIGTDLEEKRKKRRDTLGDDY